MNGNLLYNSNSNIGTGGGGEGKTGRERGLNIEEGLTLTVL